MRPAWAVLALAAASLGNSCSTPGAPRVSPVEADALVKGGAVLVDVREPSEIAETGMAAPAISIPMSRIEAGDPVWTGFLASTPKDRKVVFYCRSGRRSRIAARLATEAGFNASNAGGLDDWRRAKLPIRKAP